MTNEEADARREKDRLEAYQATCHAQGAKLCQIEALLLSESDQAEEGMDVVRMSIHQATFKHDALRAIAEILKRNNR